MPCGWRFTPGRSLGISTGRCRHAPSIPMRCGRSTAPSATSGCAPTATSSTSRWPAGSRTTSTTPTPRRIERAPLHDEVEVVVIGGGFGGLLVGRAAARRRASTTSGSSRRAATSAAPGTGTATRARRATSSRTSTCRCSRRSGYVPKEKYSARAGDPRAQPHHRAATSGSTSAPASRPRSPSCAGTRTTRRWIVVDQPRRPHAGALRHHGQRPAAPAEAARHPRRRDLRAATPSTPAAGTTPTPAATQRRDTSTGCTTRWSASSAPARRPCSACPTSARPPSTSTSSSARRRRSTCATTAPPIPEWAAGLEPGWQRTAHGQLQQPRLRHLRARGPRAATAGPTSSASCSLRLRGR